MSEGLGIIAKFLFIIAVIVIAHGGWQVRSGNADMGKMSIVGGLLLGLAVLIAEALFNAGGMPTIPITPMSKPIVQTHAGDDSDGKIWGIEGINILFILAGLLLSVGLSLHALPASGALAGIQLRRRLAALRAHDRLRLRAPAGQAASVYDTDLLETLIAGTGMDGSHGGSRATRFRMKAPNGWISHDLLIWNELDRRGFVAEGIRARNARSPARERTRSRRLLSNASVNSSTPGGIHPRAIPLVGRIPTTGSTLHRLQDDHRRTLRAGFLGGDRAQRAVQPLLAGDAVRPASPGKARSLSLEAHRDRIRRLRLSKETACRPLRRILRQFSEAFDQHRRIIASLFEPHGWPRSVDVHARICSATSRSSSIPPISSATTTTPSDNSAEEETIHQNCWHQGVQAGRKLRILCRRILSQSRHPQAPSAADPARNLSGR